MITIATMSLERRVSIREQFGRDARAMFFEGKLNTWEISQVLGIPEDEVVRKRLHCSPPPSFALTPAEMPPPTPAGGAAA
jgi:hypothetical protein